MAIVARVLWVFPVLNLLEWKLADCPVAYLCPFRVLPEAHPDPVLYLWLLEVHLQEIKEKQTHIF